MKPGIKNSYNSLTDIKINNKDFKIFSLSKAESNGLEGISKLPKSLKVLLENLLRYEDDLSVTKNQIEAIKNWLENKKIRNGSLFCRGSGGPGRAGRLAGRWRPAAAPAPRARRRPPPAARRPRRWRGPPGACRRRGPPGWLSPSSRRPRPRAPSPQEGVCATWNPLNA